MDPPPGPLKFPDGLHAAVLQLPPEQFKAFAKDHGHKLKVKNNNGKTGTISWECNECAPGKEECFKKWFIRNGQFFPTKRRPARGKPQPVQDPPPDHKVHVICCLIPEGLELLDRHFVAIPFDIPTQEVLGEQGFSELISDVPDDLRDDKRFFHQPEGGQSVLIHQTIVAMLQARTSWLDVTFWTWDTVVNNINTNKLYKEIEVLGKDGHVVLFAPSTVSSAPELDQPLFYNHLRRLSTVRGSVTLFPSETEHRWESEKIGDIKALDDIATEQREAKNDRFGYRPRTCFGVGSCSLTDLDESRLIIKRSHSAASEHVRGQEKKDRQRLKCCDGNGRTLKKDKVLYYWFHQERVETLKTLGEFRVFVCATADGAGEVVSIVHTKPGPDSIAAQRPGEHVFRGLGDYKTRKRELEEFAIFIWKRLLARPDAQMNFGSLQVGVRLDIGISEMSPNGRWFVSEITRLFDADQFAKQHLAAPYTEITKKSADAFQRYCAREYQAPSPREGERGC